MQTASPGYFNGAIDEVRLSSTARTSGWIRASWENQRPGSTFVAIAPPMTPDIDGDSLPDAWEMHHFDTIFGTPPDSDSDGVVDLLEFALGTNPNSSNDFPPPPLIPPQKARLPSSFTSKSPAAPATWEPPTPRQDFNTSPKFHPISSTGKAAPNMSPGATAASLCPPAWNESASISIPALRKSSPASES